MSKPPATEPKVPITVTIRVANRDWLDDLAHLYRLSRADVVRVALATARKHDKDLQTALNAASEV
jgi:hypothetical protein